MKINKFQKFRFNVRLIHAVFLLPGYLQRNQEILSKIMEKHGITEDELNVCDANEEKEYEKLDDVNEGEIKKQI